MGTKNVRVSDVVHTQLKLHAMEKGDKLEKVVTDIIQKYFDERDYRDETDMPIDMSDESLVYYYEQGGEILRNANESFREYTKRVKDSEGVLRC